MQVTTPDMILIESNWETPETFGNKFAIVSCLFNLYPQKAWDCIFIFTHHEEIKIQESHEIYPLPHKEGPKDRHSGKNLQFGILFLDML